MDKIGPHTYRAGTDSCAICGATMAEIEDNLAPLCDARRVREMHEASQIMSAGFGLARLKYTDTKAQERAAADIEDNLAPFCDARRVREMREANQARIPHTYRGGPGCIYCGAAQIDVEAKRVSPGCNMHAPQPLAMPEISLQSDIEALRRVRPDLSGVIDDYLALTTVAVGEIVQYKPTPDRFDDDGNPYNPWAHCLVVVTDVRPWGVIGYHYGIRPTPDAPGIYPIRLTTEEFIRTGGRVTTHPPGAVTP